MVAPKDPFSTYTGMTRDSFMSTPRDSPGVMPRDPFSTYAGKSREAFSHTPRDSPGMMHRKDVYSFVPRNSPSIPAREIFTTPRDIFPIPRREDFRLGSPPSEAFVSSQDTFSVARENFKYSPRDSFTSSCGTQGGYSGLQFSDGYDVADDERQPVQSILFFLDLFLFIVRGDNDDNHNGTCSSDKC